MRRFAGNRHRYRHLGRAAGALFDGSVIENAATPHAGFHFG
jgi:hypothetical protein